MSEETSLRGYRLLCHDQETEGMKRVYRAQNLTDAYLLKGVLETQDIKAIVQGDFLWSTRGAVPITTETCPSVWVVDEEDYERAMEIVSDFQSREMAGDSVGEEWICDKCGENNEGQFTECWQCSAERNKDQQN